MKNILLILFFFPCLLFSQFDSNDLEKTVIGVITSNEGDYLILNEGLIRISTTDNYLEYYKAIYNDSTVVNPNTEIKEDFNLNLIPFIIPNNKNKRIDFSEPLSLGVFLHIKDENYYFLTEFGESIIDSLKTNK